jgi:class 3 adenylate cyclase
MSDPSNVGAWLNDLGLGEHETLFAENHIDMDVLAELGADDLRDLGLPLGHQKRLLRAMKSYEPDTASRQLENGPIANAAPPEPAPAALPDGERRHITVVFCDLVGSTALSEQLDPEDLRNLMQAYQKACGTAVERYGGHVAQYLGDGLMVYFGWPRAHEDDAERAVRSAREIVSAIKAIDAPEPLQVHIGIASGTVVVGETGGGDASVPKLAIGETPNLAARLQGIAGPDEIIMAPRSQRLVAGLFLFDDLGKQSLKGIIEPVRA